MTRSALRRSIVARVYDQRRSLDELRVIDEVLSGLERGADRYGPLVVGSDERDWGKEAAEECRDLLAYLAMDQIARQHRRIERLACEAADEIAGFELDEVTAEIEADRPYPAYDILLGEDE